MRPSGCRPIFLYAEAVDMRKSFEGLSALVEAAFPGTLLSGTLFLFLNRRRNLIKILNWEGDGFAIWYTRLEMGTFLDCFHEARQLSRQQFVMLFLSRRELAFPEHGDVNHLSSRPVPLVV